MSIVDGILAAIELLMKLYMQQKSGGFADLVALAAKCNEEMTRIKNQEAKDEKAARDAVPR